MALLTERTKAVQAQCNDKSYRPLPNYPVKFYSSQELRDKSPPGTPLPAILRAQRRNGRRCSSEAYSCEPATSGTVQPCVHNRLPLFLYKVDVH